jgi:hypothetical protein
VEEHEQKLAAREKEVADKAQALAKREKEVAEMQVSKEAGEVARTQGDASTINVPPACLGQTQCTQVLLTNTPSWQEPSAQHCFLMVHTLCMLGASLTRVHTCPAENP